jgi:hypothetical protein
MNERRLPSRGLQQSKAPSAMCGSAESIILWLVAEVTPALINQLTSGVNLFARSEMPALALSHRLNDDFTLTKQQKAF